MENKRIGYLSWNNTERVLRYLENGYTLPEIARTINVPLCELYDFVQRRFAEKEIIKEQKKEEKREKIKKEMKNVAKEFISMLDKMAQQKKEGKEQP